MTERLRWKPTTVYRKLSRSRTRIKNGLPLSSRDVPLPDSDEPGAPRWKVSTLENYVANYHASKIPSANTPAVPSASAAAAPVTTAIATAQAGAADPANLAGLEIRRTGDTIPSLTVKTHNGTRQRGRHKLREGEPREWLDIGRRDRWQDRED